MSAEPKESSAPLAEISQGPNAFEEFLDRNQKGIAVFAVLLALGAAGLVIQRGLETNRQEDAGAALVKADDLAGFQGLIDSHTDTKAAGSAMVLLANTQWTDGKKDEAVGTLRKFISENPDHAATPTAKASLGSKLMSQGKSGDAVKVFDEIVSNPAAEYIAPFALISLGDIAKADGDLEKAESTYAKVSLEFPDSNFSETATRRIATLKAKPPVEIEPPPAAETPANPSDAIANPMDALKSQLPPGFTVTPVPDEPEAPGTTEEIPEPAGDEEPIEIELPAPAHEGSPESSGGSSPEPAAPEQP